MKNRSLLQWFLVFPSEKTLPFNKKKYTYTNKYSNNKNDYTSNNTDNNFFER
jgi:hypothetical protein